MNSGRKIFRIVVLLSLLSLSYHSYGKIAACSSEQKFKIAHGLEAIKSQGKFYLNHLNLLKKKSNYYKFEGEISFAETGITHNFLYYETKKAQSKKAPLVVIYPGIGGTTYFEKYLANYYTLRGISVVISHYIDEVKMYNINNIRGEMVTNLSVGFSLVDFMTTLPTIDSDKISIIGVSYGGIRGVYHTALDKRIKSATLMVAGAPFEEILANSDLETVSKIRSQQMSNAGIESHEEYVQTLKDQIIPITDFICQRETSEFFLIISDDDEWVPTNNQWELWEMLGNPDFEKSDLGHIGTPLWLGLRKVDFIHRFFASLWDVSYAHR